MQSIVNPPGKFGGQDSTPPRFIGPEERRRYEEDGFVVLRGLFNTEELAAIVEWLRGVARRRHELPSWHIIPEPGAPEDPDDPLTAVRKFQALPTIPKRDSCSVRARPPPKPRANCSKGTAARTARVAGTP
jgi:hypothetical protein